MTVKKYNPDFCKHVVELGLEGRSKTQMAAEFSVSIGTLNNWLKDRTIPEFREAMELALTCSQAYWEDLGMKGAKGILLKFNPAAWSFVMKNRFRADYTDTVDQRIDINNTVKSLSDEEIDETIKLLTARRINESNGSEGSLPLQ